MVAMKSGLVRRLVLLALLCTAACKFAYPEDVNDDGGLACTANTTTCTGSTLAVCDAAGHPTTSSCAFGCFTSGDRCADLDPSNGLAQYLDQARNAPPLHLVGGGGINTDTGQFGDGSIAITTVAVTRDPVDILVVIAGSLEADGVTAVGSRALAFVVDGDVTLHGDLSVSAYSGLGFSLNLSGAGAGSHLDPACTAMRGAFTMTGYAGAGGGGHGSPGGRGGDGNGTSGGSRGESAGNEVLVPLRGGCPGAQPWGTPELANPQGGPAGGAIQISARGTIRIEESGAVSANAGGAAGVFRSPCPFEAGDPPGCNAGGGGGAGGGILLEAARLELATTASITANGGGGSCDFRGGGGWATRTESPAPGQDCTMSSEAGSGGRGGAAEVGASDGGNGTVTGGGGGGGAGRIRINLPAGVTFDPGPPIVSPAPSMGVVATR